MGGHVSRSRSPRRDAQSWARKFASSLSYLRPTNRPHVSSPTIPTSTSTPLSVHRNLGLASIRPNSDSNLRCTFHSSTQCDAPMTDATRVTYPGVNSLSQSPQSVFCLSSAITPANVEKSLVGFCGAGADRKGCFTSDQNPDKCSIMFAPS